MHAVTDAHNNSFTCHLSSRSKTYIDFIIIRVVYSPITSDNTKQWESAHKVCSSIAEYSILAILLQSEMRII